jgi:predicted membrane channel-forming protein YqfA (hemolysin III family)
MAIYFIYGRFQEVALLNHLLEQDNRNKMVWIHFALWTAIPILGILFELVGQRRVAKWLNIGYFVLVGFAFSAIGIVFWSDYHGRIALLPGLAALAVGGMDYLLYRLTRPTPAPAVSPTL